MSIAHQHLILWQSHSRPIHFTSASTFTTRRILFIWVGEWEWESNLDLDLLRKLGRSPIEAYEPKRTDKI